MQTLTTLADVNAYLRGISKRLRHHGPHWRPVVQTLALELQARLAPGEPLYARTYGGQLANQIILTLRNGRQVKVTYHAKAHEISIRDANTQRTIHIFRATDDPERVATRCRQLAFRPPVRLRAVA